MYYTYYKFTKIKLFFRCQTASCQSLTRPCASSTWLSSRGRTTNLRGRRSSTRSYASSTRTYPRYSSRPTCWTDWRKSLIEITHAFCNCRRIFMIYVFFSTFRFEKIVIISFGNIRSQSRFFNLLIVYLNLLAYQCTF